MHLGQKFGEGCKWEHSIHSIQQDIIIYCHIAMRLWTSTNIHKWESMIEDRDQAASYGLVIFWFNQSWIKSCFVSSKTPCRWWICNLLSGLKEECFKWWRIYQEVDLPEGQQTFQLRKGYGPGSIQRCVHSGAKEYEEHLGSLSALNQAGSWTLIGARKCKVLRFYKWISGYLDTRQRQKHTHT